MRLALEEDRQAAQQPWAKNKKAKRAQQTQSEKLQSINIAWLGERGRNRPRQPKTAQCVQKHLRLSSELDPKMQQHSQNSCKTQRIVLCAGTLSLNFYIRQLFTLRACRGRSPSSATNSASDKDASTRPSTALSRKAATTCPSSKSVMYLQTVSRPTMSKTLTHIATPTHYEHAGQTSRAY